MGLKSQINLLSGLKLNPALRQIVLPDETTGIGTVATMGNNPLFGAWVDVALLAAVTLPTLVTGVCIDTPSATAIYTIQIGSCAGYANAAALNAVPAAVIAAFRASIRFHYLIVGLAGYTIHPVIMLPSPIYIPAGVGILARGYTVAGAETIGVSVLCLQGF